MTKKRTYSPEFKARVVRELVEGDDSVGVVAARHHLNANMVSGWRKQLFDNAQVIFAQGQRIREVDEERAENPRYGARSHMRNLARYGIRLGRHHVARLMRRMGIRSAAPQPRTSAPAKRHPKIPYLLRGKRIDFPARCGPLA